MNSIRKYFNTKLFTLGMAVSFLGLLMLNPKIAISSVLNGIQLWYYNVMPSLFPFMIFSNILFQMNIAYYLCRLFNKPTNAIFNVSGNGILPIVMGYISGYPLGAKLVCDLRKNDIISLKESYKLIAMCSTTGPAFIIGIVSVQMFDNMTIAPVLLISNYIGSIINALLVKPFYRESIATSAIKRLKDKNFTNILNDSIVDSIQSILKIGGYMVFFNVLINYLDAVKLLDVLTRIFTKFFNVFGLSRELIKGILYGFFEITLGINVVSKCNDPILVRTAVTAFIIAWSGLSIHMQTNSFLVDTDIKYSRFFLFKVSQSIISTIVAIIGFKILYPKTVQVYKAFDTANYFIGLNAYSFHYSCFGVLTVLILLTYLYSKYRHNHS